MRCPSCGAANPQGAQWCGQCFAPFSEPDPEPAAAGGRAGEPPAGTAEAPGSDPPDGARVRRSGFRKTGELLEWQCAACGEFNAIDLASCQACGTSFAARYRPEPEPAQVSWSTAMALSAVLPGAGHVLAGRAGAGVARALLFGVWLIGGLLLLLAAGGQAVLAAVPLLIGAAVVWAGTLLDVMALQRGSGELLSGRALLWLVVGVTVLLLLSALGGAARLR